MNAKLQLAAIFIFIASQMLSSLVSFGQEGICDSTVNARFESDVFQNQCDQCGSDLCQCCPSIGCGVYLSVFGGGVDNENLHVGSLDTIEMEASFKSGWILGTAIGKQFAPRLRGEFEFSYRNNSAELLTTRTNNPLILPAPPEDLSGALNSYLGMLNLYADSQPFGLITPYVGGGVGISIVDGEFSGQLSSRQFNIDESKFAYQGIAGARLLLNPQFQLFGEYRYFASSDIDVDSSSENGSFANSSNNVIFGITYQR